MEEKEELEEKEEEVEARELTEEAWEGLRTIPPRSTGVQGGSRKVRVMSGWCGIYC